MNNDSVSSAENMISKQEIAAFALALWLILISVFMVLTQSVNFEIFFVLYLIGLVITVELISPKYIKPGYLRYLQFIVAVAIVIFGVIVIQKIMDILGLEFVIHY